VGNVIKDVLSEGAQVEVLNHLRQHLATDLEFAITWITKYSGASHCHPARRFPFFQRHMEAGQKSHCVGAGIG
jgi:hypothetical protein